VHWILNTNLWYFGVPFYAHSFGHHVEIVTAYRLYRIGPVSTQTGGNKTRHGVELYEPADVVRPTKICGAL